MSKQIGKQISIDQGKNRTQITITDRLEGWMRIALLGWIVVWLSLGIYVIGYLFRFDLAKETLLFFVIYLAFWGWFAYKSLYAYLFKTHGFEWVEIDTENELLSYGRNILGMASVKSQFTPDQIDKVERIEQGERSFGSAYSKSFWIVGNEQLLLKGKSKNQLIGMHLSPKDANALLGELNRRIKQFRKS